MEQRDDSPVYQVYRIGEGYATGADGKPMTSWPYAIFYAPDHPDGPFFAEEGDARNGNGGFIPAARLLEPIWRSHLEITNTLWLLPLLERLVQGETVPPSEFLDAYQSVHGTPPPTEEWKPF